MLIHTKIHVKKSFYICPLPKWSPYRPSSLFMIAVLIFWYIEVTIQEFIFCHHHQFKYLNSNLRDKYVLLDGSIVVWVDILQITQYFGEPPGEPKYKLTGKISSHTTHNNCLISYLLSIRAQFC